MKKILLGVVVAVLVISIGITSTFAIGSAYGRNYADADNNGVCDNYEAIVDGVRAAGRYCGRSYADADNDGVCGNYGGGRCSQNGAGRGYGAHRRCKR